MENQESEKPEEEVATQSAQAAPSFGLASLSMATSLAGASAAVPLHEEKAEAKPEKRGWFGRKK